MAREDLPAVLAIESDSNPAPWRAAEFEAYLGNGSGAASGPRAWVCAAPAPLAFLCCSSATDEAELQAIAVDPSHRRAGLGSDLMRAFLAWAAAAGIRTVHLEVREGNAGARAFYARWGFAETGRRARYYRDNGETAVLMAKRI